MKKIFLLFCLFYTHVLLFSETEIPSSSSANSYTVIEDKATLPILAPSYIDRKTLKIRLSNGLEAYIISDPVIEKSAAVLIVNTGSWEDPIEHPGLAHFLEHMLFLGTKKYPEESSYDAFIKANGGLDNAFTDDLYTAYLFDVDHQAFPEALDRFSQFFKEPLLSPSGVAREMHAIAQEYAENIENDDVRQAFVQKALANPEHPEHSFNIGNASTLSGVSTDYLRKWFEEHYSANGMKLVIYSALPIDVLKQLVVEDFHDIPNRHKQPFSSPFPIFSKDFDKTIAYIAPLNEIHTLTLTWEIPTHLVNLSESRPEELLCYILGHEGKESLFTELQREGLAEELGCSKMKSGNQNAMFMLQIDLTRKGVKQVYQVIERCFQALAGIRKTGIPRYIFDDIHQMATIRYQYPSHEDAFQEMMKHALKIRSEEISSYPEYQSIVQKYDPVAIKELLNYLTPANCHISLMAPPKETGVEPDRQEEWLKVDYAVKPVPEAIFKAWEDAKPHPNITLPMANPFIPKHLALLHSMSEKKGTFAYPHPKLIQDDASGKIYFSEDIQYNLPNISWILKIKTPQISGSDPSKIVMADLYIKYLKEVLNPFSYPATMAELEYDITRQENGIEISVSGYSENAKLLMEEIIRNLKLPPPSSAKFKTLKDSLQRQYLNFENESPLQLGLELLKGVIYKDFVPECQKLKAIKQISLQSFSEYLADIYSKRYIEGMFYGNMHAKQAEELQQFLQSTLNGIPYPKSEQKDLQIIDLPQDEGPYYLEKQVKSRGNAVILIIEDLPYDYKAQAVQQILSQAIMDPFFTELRTKQQTGYLVFQTYQDIEKHLFSIFAVQSHSHDSRDLLARIELFIEMYAQHLPLQIISEENFNSIKKALVFELTQPPQNLKKMGEELYKMAYKYDGNFDWYVKRTEAIQELSYAEFVKNAQQFLSKQNKRRFAVLMKGKIPENQKFHYTKAKSAAWMCENSDYSTHSGLTSQEEEKSE